MSAEFQKIISVREESSLLGRVMNSQPFWAFVTLIALCIVMTLVSDAFSTNRNLFNTSRNLTYIAIVALGMTTVIAIGGIDLSVGSIMGMSAVLLAVTMAGGAPMWVGALVCLGSAAAAGLINGILIAYLGLSPFVVTLGMLAAARSVALVLSSARMFSDFGPDQGLLFAIGSGSFLGLSTPVWVLAILTLAFALLFKYSAWGVHVFAIGGNAQAARVVGVEVERVIVSAYVVSGLTAGLAAFLMVAWLGSVTGGFGQAYELQVIAAAVIGGANLVGGQAYAIGAPIGAALVEVIRNSLLLAGVDPYWQGLFLGALIVAAVLLGTLKERRS
jgi:ribose transport system permease protein